MRIAVVAPPWYEIPPRGYGGIERVCYDLVEGLVDRGHDVTLVATGRNLTSARFVAALPEPPPGLGTLEAPVQEVLYGAEAAAAIADLGLDLDIVHDHSLAGPLATGRGRGAGLVTAHGPAADWLGRYYRALRLPLVALSRAQRRAAPELPWVGVVPNGIDVDSFRIAATKGDYALFLGRLSPEKGAHLAAAAARAAGIEIVIAGKCTEPHEQAYYEQEVAPLLADGATFVGEVHGERKVDLLARARCMLAPVQWEEPFGIACIEALASGTPVVGLGRGALPELVDHGRTGWLADDVDALPALIRRAGEIDPLHCRAAASARFSADAMVTGYERVYRQLLDEPADERS
jgi:glycosyltransferase involved in cell wall biosynthesis